MGESKLTSKGKEKILSRMNKMFLLLIIITMCIFVKNKNICADTIGVPEDISVEMGNMKFVMYYFTGDNCKNIEFRKTGDPDDQSLKIRVRDKQVGNGYAYYSVEYYGYAEDYVSVVPYDVNTGTAWNRYYVHVQAPQIDINSCNGEEIEFSFYSFSDEDIDIGYYGINDIVYHGNGLKYTKTIWGGYGDQNDLMNVDKIIWMYRYDCKLTLYTNGTYNALLYKDGVIKSRLNLNIHDHICGEAQKEDIVEPTCGEPGSYKSVTRCTQCNTILSWSMESIDPTGNHSIAFDKAIEPTCTEEGKKVRTCNYCEETETEIISKLGHEEVLDKEVPTTCVGEGKTEGSHCSRCGEVIKEQKTIPATGHSWTEWKVINESNCTDKGSKSRKCTICGFIENTEVDANGHIWENEFRIDKEPTCINDGAKSIHCKICGIAKDSQTISANGHKYGLWKTTKSATVFQKGMQQRVCVRCNNKQQKSIEKLKPTIKISKTKITLKVKKSTVIKVRGLAKGDSVKSWNTSNKKIATVTKSGKVTAKKKGKVIIKVILKSGKN